MIKRIKLLTIIFPIILISCNQNKSSEKEISPNKESEISIEVDDRIQVFRLAYNLAIMDSIPPGLRPCKDQFYSKHYLPYKQFSNHPIVQRIAKGDLWNGDLPMLALALDRNLVPKKNLDKSVLKDQFGWYGENLDSVSNMLVDFKETIDFKNNYNINFEPLKDSIQSNEVTKKLDEFYRIETKSNLKIYFDPLNNITSRSINFLPENDLIREYVLANICKKQDSTPTKEILTPKWNRTNRRITFHENSHLYTDQFFKKYYSEEFNERLKEEKFADVRTNIQEIIVRGLTAKIIELNYGEIAGQFEYDRLWSKSKIVFDQLEDYSINTDMSFEEIFQQIIKELENSYS